MDMMGSLLLFSETVSLCLFQFCQFNSTFLPCWKFVHKSGCSIELISCLSKAFESILNREILKHTSLYNFPSDCHYGFCQGYSTGDLLAFLTESYSSCFGDFCETFAVALDLDISKDFESLAQSLSLQSIFLQLLSISLQLHLKFPSNILLLL